MAISDLIGLFTNKFTDTVIYKKDSELENKIQAINNLLKKYPNNEKLLKMLRLCELGLQGEEEIEFELKNANIGMYVLHDVNLQYKDLKAQIDYIIITPARTYFIECKNLIGNITIDKNGNFIREYSYGNKKIKEGIYSPVTQAQRHVEIFKKIWMERNTGIIARTITLKNFDQWRIPLVVLANSKNIINNRYAPREINKMVIKSDRLVSYIKKDIENTSKDLLYSKKEMNECAYSLMNYYNVDINRNYEKEIEETLKNDISSINIDNSIIKNNLLNFRKTKSKEKNIPAYYIFNNEELDKILELMPKTIQELSNANILSDVKLRLHGKEIIKIINN